MRKNLLTGVSITSPEPDGASAVAFKFNTDSTYSTGGANLLRLSNNGTGVFDFSFQGGIDHVNSGASTAAHAQSLNLNWTATSTRTSSGQYSTVIGANCTASGNYSVALGSGGISSGTRSFTHGNFNIASSTDSVAMGNTNDCSGPASLVIGTDAVLTPVGAFGIGAGKFSSVGDAQIQISTLRIATTDATQTAMLTPDVLGKSRVTIPADTSWVFSALIIGRSDEADGNDSGAYRIEGCLTRDESNNTALVGSVTVTTIAESAGATAWSVTATADDTNEALAIQVTGEAATNIRWVAKVDIAQVTYA